MAWLSPFDMARLLKIAPRTLRERFQRKPEDFKRDGEGLYWSGEGALPDIECGGCGLEIHPNVPCSYVGGVDKKLADAVSLGRDRNPGHDSAFDEVGARVSLADLEHYDEEGNRYEYVPPVAGRGDRYVFALRSKAKTGKPFVLDGDTVRALVLAYSNDGSKATLNELSRTFGMHRATVREILRALGKTHDSAPFTDEEIAERPEDSLAEDAIRLKEERVLRRAEKASWDETRKLADKARHFDKFVAERIEHVIATSNFAPPSKAPSIAEARIPALRAFVAVVGLTDLHFGSAGWRDEVGHEINRAIVRERAISTTRRLIARVLRLGRPAKWILPAGSDNLHADTDLGTTTKGTPLDTDGSFARMFLEGCSLYEELIGMLRAVAPVQVIAMPGNHDRIASMMLTHWLSARYSEADDVEIGSAVAHRTYVTHGAALCGFTHGDDMQDSKLPLLMATEASEKWGSSRHRVIFTGHIHTEKANEYAGVRVVHMGCLATADRYHFRHAYTGNTKVISAYLVDEEEGLIASLPVQPPSDEAAR